MGEANDLFNLADEQMKLGDRESAIVNMQAALEIYEQIESPYAEKARRALAKWTAESSE